MVTMMVLLGQGSACVTLMPSYFHLTDGETEAGRGRRFAPSPSPGAVGLQSCARKWPGGRVSGHHTETSFTDPVFSEAEILAVPLLEEADVQNEEGVQRYLSSS